MRILPAILFAAAALVFNAAPCAAANEDQPILAHFTIENVTEILTGLGAKVEASGAEESGNKYIRFVHLGRRYNASLWACNNSDNCFGMLMFATFVGGTYSLEAVNDFNNRRALGKASVVVDNGQQILTSSRYIFSDGGVTRLTVVGEFLGHFQVTDHLIEDLKNAGVVAEARSAVRPVSHRAAAKGGKTPNHSNVPLIVNGSPANRF